MPSPFESDEPLDAKALAESVSSDLFPKSEPVEENSANTDAPELGTSAPAIPDPRDGLTAAQIKALPKSWKKEMEAHWGKLPPEVHDYVYEREANVMRGLQQYQGGYNNWDALIKPYQKLLQENPNVNPIELMHGLMNSHLKLLQATPEQRRQYAAQMLSHYGIDINAGAAPAGDENPLSRTVQELQAKITQLEQGFTQTQRAAYEAGYEQNLRLVKEFGSKPENKYFEELGTDILHLLRTGAAKDLPSAYQMACWTNPAVRAKMIAEQQSEPPAGQAPAAKPTFPNVNGSPDAKPRKSRPVSMDDTINGVVAKHFGPH